MPDNEVTILPDGSAFAVVEMALPADHWLYSRDIEGFVEPPPMTIRAGTASIYRKELVTKITQAARYAVRASTACGKVQDFDPDAMVQNMIIGLVGYFTEDGLGSEPWQNPDPIPPELK
jgi:hypothetical protein